MRSRYIKKERVGIINCEHLLGEHVEQQKKCEDRWLIVTDGSEVEILEPASGTALQTAIYATRPDQRDIFGPFMKVRIMFVNSLSMHLDTKGFIPDGQEIGHWRQPDGFLPNGVRVQHLYDYSEAVMESISGHGGSDVLWEPWSCRGYTRPPRHEGYDLLMRFCTEVRFEVASSAPDLLVICDGRRLKAELQLKP
ncbi:MAG: hypothetical protein ABH826_02405 [Patescibacteria group bacterium]|nr:hypothetical protein [Patescibacteria group bacterium]